MFSTVLTQQDLLKYVVRLFIIMLILPLHEYAHAWTAYKLGDDTARYQGRLTLNPIAHLDPIGSILLLLTGYGWAKPVPIDPTRFTRKHSIRFGVAITALAGPLSNLIAAFIGMIVLRIYETTDLYAESMTAYALSGTAALTAPVMLMLMLSAFISINIGLAVFNLVPIPPLDGSKIASYFTSGRFDRWFDRNYQIVRIVFMVVVLTGILSVPLEFIDSLVYTLFRYMTAWIPALIG